MRVIAWSCWSDLRRSAMRGERTWFGWFDPSPWRVAREGTLLGDRTRSCPRLTARFRAALRVRLECTHQHPCREPAGWADLIEVRLPGAHWLDQRRPRTTCAARDRLARPSKMPDSRISKRRVLRAPNSSRLNPPRSVLPCLRSVARDSKVGSCGGGHSVRIVLLFAPSERHPPGSRDPRVMTSSCRGRERDTRMVHARFPQRESSAVRWCLGQRRSDEPSFTTAHRSKGL